MNINIFLNMPFHFSGINVGLLKKVLHLAFFHLPVYLDIAPYQYMWVYFILFNAAEFYAMVRWTTSQFSIFKVTI